MGQLKLFIESCLFSSNSVSDLSPLSKCKQLTQLALRRNKVSDLHQLIHLKDLPKLKTLWLLDNPVAEDEQYRKSVIRMLPQLNKLDGKGKKLFFVALSFVDVPFFEIP